MKTLHDYYSIIDKPDFDGKTDEDVIKLLPPYIPENPDSIFIVRECNAFKIRKSFNYKNDPKKGTANGLSWMCSGKITNEDGKKVDVYIPDVRALKQDDFEYYESRYYTCSSLYPKVQYGLLVYFGQATTFSKRNEFKSKYVKN